MSNPTTNHALLGKHIVHITTTDALVGRLVRHLGSSNFLLRHDDGSHRVINVSRLHGCRVGDNASGDEWTSPQP